MDITTLGAAVAMAKKVMPQVTSADAGKLATVDSNGKWAAAELDVGQGEVAVDSTLLVTGAAADAKVTGDKVAELKSAVDEIGTSSGSINLFDGTIWSTDGYINSNGSFISASGYKTTAPIYLKAGSYLFDIKYSAYGASSVIVAICLEDGTIQSVVTGTNTGEKFSDLDIILFNLNTDSYIRTNIGASAGFIDTYMLVKGDSADDYPTTYIPYQPDIFVLSDNIGLTNTMKQEILSIQNKKIALNGDSICYGAGYTGGYGKILSELYDMTIQNIAISGGTITAGTYNGSEPRHWICRTINQMDTDSDYAIIEGGANDASLGVTKGTLTAGFAGPFDDTTFIGALESTFKQLTTNFAGKKIGFILVHKCSWAFSNEGHDNDNYYWAARKCCEKWGIPYLDLNIACPPFGVVTSEMTDLYALRVAYTSNADGWHPNEDGYRKYYVPKIAAWLETL